MVTFSLQSGSNGNAVYVEADGVRLLFDSGISGKMAERRMLVHDRDIRNVDALIISHDHRDHVVCAGIYQRKFGLPIFITHKTLRAASRWCDLGRLTDVRHFRAGESLPFGSVTVHSVPTVHDTADGVGFVVESDGKRLGILTDLGHAFDGLQTVVESLDAVYLEANYDAEMLDTGQYPAALKARIRGPHGHLSNDDAAVLIQACRRRRPKWTAVAHLSEENNSPDLAISAQHNAVGRDYPVHLASRYDTSELLTV